MMMNYSAKELVPTTTYFKCLSEIFEALDSPDHNAIFTSRKGAKINFEFKRFKTIDNSQWVFLVSKDVIYHILSIFECAMKIGNFFPSSIFYKFLKNENVG